MCADGRRCRCRCVDDIERCTRAPFFFGHLAHTVYTYHSRRDAAGKVNSQSSVRLIGKVCGNTTLAMVRARARTHTHSHSIIWRDRLRVCVPNEDSNHLGESPSLALPFPKWRTLECVAPSRRTLQVITAFNGIHAHTHSLIHTHSHVFVFLPRVLNWAERTRKMSESVICYVIRMVMAALFADLEISQNNTVNSAVTQTTCKTIAQALGRSRVSPHATSQPFQKCIYDMQTISFRAIFIAT